MMKMKLMNKVLAAIILFSVASCAPLTKDKYMERYEAFISDVSENYKSYNYKDWNSKQKKYEKFSGKWYEKFKDKLTVRDEIAVKSYQARWMFYYNFSDVSRVIESILDNENVKVVKERIQFYIENDMKSDLQELYKKAVDAGEDVQNVVTEVLEDSGVDIEELKRNVE
ncbi:MAG: hypothetical protein IKR52_00980 [Paludibacteraceae bacterium]|nr:hypothetical protein [Paludibacteraceae bacterium]